MLSNLQNENDRRSTGGFLHTYMHRANLPASVHVAQLEQSGIGFEYLLKQSP